MATPRERLSRMAHGNRSLLLADFSIKRLIHQATLLIAGVRIVSYPRSGRTWLRLMLHDLGIDPRFTHAGSKDDLRRPPEEICLGMEKYHRRRIVFLHRDPRDVIVSYLHHSHRRGLSQGDLSSFIRDPGTGFERILAFNLGWLEAAGDFRAFMPISYEDLRARSQWELERLVEFMGCPLVRTSDIGGAVANNSFEHMKRRERSGELHDRFGDRFTPGGTSDDRMIVRRGVVGGHSDELSPDDRAFCDALLARYDYFGRVAVLTGQTFASAQA